jgi:hypothetical protein
LPLVDAKPFTRRGAIAVTDLDSPPWDREPDQTIPVLRDEEDEPNFRPLLECARSRMKALAAKGQQEDATLIRDLLGMIQHLYGEIDAMENHISDYGPAVDEDDDPAFLNAILADA